MIIWQRINNRTLQATKDTGETVSYEVVIGHHPVNEQQYNLKVGSALKYSDGAKVIRIEGYYLLRNWFYDGHYWDRIAIPAENVYLQMN